MFEIISKNSEKRPSHKRSQTLEYLQNYSIETWKRGSFGVVAKGRGRIMEPLDGPPVYITQHFFNEERFLSEKTTYIQFDTFQSGNYEVVEITNQNLFEDIDNAIEYSKNIEYDENHNDTPVPDFVWRLTRQFLMVYTNWIKENYKLLIEIPDITALPNGSVDILWHNKKGKMLVNIDNSEDNKAYYYSDFHNKKNPIKGNVLINEIDESLGIRLKKLNEYE